MGGNTEEDDGSFSVKITREGRINVPKKLVDAVDQTGGSADFMVNGTLLPIKPTKDGRIRFGIDGLGLKGKTEVKLVLSAGGRSITITA